MNLRHAANASPRVSSERSSLAEPDERSKVARHPRALAFVGKKPHDLVELHGSCLGVVRLEDPRLRLTISPSAQYETPSP